MIPKFRSACLSTAAGLLMTTATGWAADADVASIHPPLARAAGATAPVIVLHRSGGQPAATLNQTLETPMTIDGIAVLPVGTVIGREKFETQVDATTPVVRQSTELNDVTLNAAVTISDPAVGPVATLAAGTTIVSLRTEQSVGTDGTIRRDRLDLRAIQPDGSVLRVHGRGPGIGSAFVSAELPEAAGDFAGGAAGG